MRALNGAESAAALGVPAPLELLPEAYRLHPDETATLCGEHCGLKLGHAAVGCGAVPSGMGGRIKAFQLTFLETLKVNSTFYLLLEQLDAYNYS